MISNMTTQIVFPKNIRYVTPLSLACIHNYELRIMNYELILFPRKF